MRKDVLKEIASLAAMNSVDGIDEEKIQKMIDSTEKTLGVELSGYATIDKPYRQFYTKQMLESEYPKDKISTAILKRALTNSTKVAYRCERNLTYGELYDEVINYAYVLKNKYKIQKGDKIIMDVLSTPDAISAFLAANLIGAEIRPIDPIYSPQQINKILVDYDPKVIICNALHYENIKKAIGERNIPVNYIRLRSNMPFLSKTKKALINSLESANEVKMKLEKANNFNSFEKDLKSIANKNIKIEDVMSEYVPNEIAAIFSTSGTTGTAKGVEVTNENFLSNVHKEYISGFDIKDGDSLFNPMPTCSSFFWYTIAFASFLGVTTSLSPVFDAKVSTKQIAKDESTWVLLGPIIINQLCDFIDNYENLISDDKFVTKIKKILLKEKNKKIVESIKGKSHYISGGDLLSIDLEKKAKARNLVIHNNLGTSENTGPSTNPNGVIRGGIDYYEGSVGVPLPGNDVGIFLFDEENDLPALDAPNYVKGLKYYEVGEICFDGKNPNVFQGYYQNEKETNKTILKHADGTVWYHSGDLGYIDPAGHMFCCGRKNGLIVRDGHKVWAARIENVTKEVDGIRDCAIIGVNHEKEKEAPAMFIVFKEDIQQDKKEETINKVYSQIEKKLDNKHVPVYWKELDEIPRNLMAKTRISELKKIYDESNRNNNDGPQKTIKK